MQIVTHTLSDGYINDHISLLRHEKFETTYVYTRTCYIRVYFVHVEHTNSLWLEPDLGDPRVKPSRTLMS